MDEMGVTPRPEDDDSNYEAPAVETRTSARDPLVWTVTSPIICL